MHLSRLLLAIAGHRPEELSGHPFTVTHRRIALGALAVGSALIGGVMFGIAMSRIDPSSPWRYAVGLLAGSLYFLMLLTFDALFVVGNARPRPAAIAARVAVSLMMTAFSSVTLDAVIAGNRLDAEIDSRRLEADLAARSRHAQVHDVKGKQDQLKSALGATQTLEQRLAADPDTPTFVAVVERQKNADQRLRQVTADVDRKIGDLRAQIAEGDVQLQGLPPGPAATALRARMAPLKARLSDLVTRLRAAEREAAAAAAAVTKARQEWRDEIHARIDEARRVETDARSSLSTAQGLAEKGAAASRSVNARSFQPNVVEQTAAFWGLAQRETAYRVLGFVVWLCSIALELLAVLVKLQLKPDAVDLERQHHEALTEQARDAELEFHETAGRAAALRSREERMSAESAQAELEALAALHERSTELTVQAWRDTQKTKAGVPYDTVHAALDRQFEAVQGALAAKLQALLERLASRSGGAASAGPAAPGADPSMVTL